jgi:hypothetical protein
MIRGAEAASVLFGCRSVDVDAVVYAVCAYPGRCAQLADADGADAVTKLRDLRIVGSLAVGAGLAWP